MRTTLTLDDDVVRQLKQRVIEKHGSFKQVVNETLRRGLCTGEKPSPQQPHFEIHAEYCGFKPGIDPLRLNQLLDEEDTARFIALHGQTRTHDT